MLDEKDQRNVLAQGRPQPDQAAEQQQVAAAGQQRVAGTPEQQADCRDDRRHAEQHRQIRGAVAGRTVVGEQCPGDEKDEYGQAAQQLGRRDRHWVRWLAM
ncbi:hypothetical protein SDC9_185850 [bioreactor metagenome]|uniref:Uncharacterized protein n=1 Tax=bioreactor metagenome TaxID=1076179 RepID=A0A645HIA0_9ZZZZ